MGYRQDTGERQKQKAMSSKEKENVAKESIILESKNGKLGMES